MIAFAMAVLAAATGPLGVLVGLAVLLLLIGAWVRDCARQRGRRTRLVALAVASRARSLDECPPEFHARLRQAMNLDQEEVA